MVVHESTPCPQHHPHNGAGAARWRAVRALAMLCLVFVTGLITACGESSRAISIIGPTPPTLTSIAVTPANTTIKTGSTLQFIATGLYSDGSGQNITATVTWTSSAPSVAAFAANSGGLAGAVGSGTTTITATLGAVSASTLLTVTSANLTSISIAPAAATVAAGSTQQYIATGLYSDNSKQNLTALASWHGVNPAVATVSNAAGSQGLATAAGAGTTTITASYGGVIGSATLTVTPATLVSIAVTPPNGSIAKGSNEAIIATATYSDGSTQNVTTTVMWSTGDATIATVSAVTVPTSGEIATAVAPGTTTITAALGAVSGTASITVTNATLMSIAVTPAAPPSIANGTTVQFTATGTYTDGTTQPLAAPVWNSSDPTKATIAAGGLATAIAPGTTTITAAVGTLVSPGVTLTVTAATLMSIAIAPTNPTALNPVPTIEYGSTQAFVATGTFSDNTTQDITTLVVWTSATPATATISSEPSTNAGVAASAALGTTVITAALGMIMSNTMTLTVVGGFAYAANFGSNNISEYAIGADGLLAPLTAPNIAAGTNPYSLTVDATGKFLYAANYTASTMPTTGSLSQYSIGADHTLSAIGASLTVFNGPNSIAAHPSLPAVYVAYYDAQKVQQFSIGATGLLTAGATVVAGTNPAAIALTPTGSYAYVANYGSSNDVSQYSVDPITGALTPLTPASVPTGGSGANFIVVGPFGRFVYVANDTTGDVSQLSIGSGGVLTAIAPPVAAGSGAWSVTIDAASQNAYVPNRGSNSVSHFTIDTNTGNLTLKDTLSGGSLDGPTSLSIDLSGKFAYVTNRGPNRTTVTTTITQCIINADGSLSVAPTPTATSGTNPADIITVK